MKTQSTQKAGGAQLLMQRRFGPLFWTQFCGAFNDNLYKNALVILITFKAYCEKLSFNHLELGLVPVIPTALQGLWGSLFSRKHQRLGQKLRHNKLWSRVELRIGQPIAPEKVSAPLLQEKVASLLARVG